MPNYQNGKIYCIRSFKTDDIYIGSTTQLLCRRIDQHRQDYKSWINGCKKYCTSFELIKHDDAYIELHKKYPCNSKEELRSEEGKCQREMDCVNKQIAGRTKKEYYEDNKQSIIEQHKEYTSRPEVKKKKKEYYKNYDKNRLNKEERKEYQKEWINKNKEKISERNKQHRKDNIEMYKKRDKENYEKRKQKITCICGKEVTIHHKKKHEQSQKHIQFIEAQN